MLFEGARLIVGDGRVIENSAFLVENAQFTRIGRKGEIQTPRGASRIDVTGKTVMPAMVDVHSHLGFLTAKDGRMAKENFNRDNLLDHLRRYAYLGFAAAISTGTDMGDLPYQLRTETHAGAARFRTVGLGLAWPGSGPNDPSRNDVPYAVTTEAQARAAVRELAPKKPDFVKIWVDDRNNTVQKMTPPLYRAAIDEAHKNNLRVLAHVFDLDDAKGLVRAGADGFLHLVRDADIDDELIGLLKMRPQVFFTPNIGITSRGIEAGRPAWLDEPLLREMLPPSQIKRLEDAFANRSPDALERSRADWERTKRNIARLRAAGVPLVLGSDAGGDPSRTIAWHALWEVESLAAAGIPRADVIAMSTRLAAAALKLDDLGVVASGKSADFVVLNANPLDDITNIRRIAAVYLRGQEVDRGAMRAKWQAEWRGQTN
jgi:imidazolonepropionase-like amidohydrolase